MKIARDVGEFFRLNDKDLTNILMKTFKKVVKYHSVEDLKSEIYLRLHKKSYIENYRPLEIEIDKKNCKWVIKPSHAKFSTYICKFIFNYIYAYYNKIHQDELCLSLDNYNDSCYDEETKTKINFDVEEKNPISEMNLKLEIERLINVLEKKTKKKGSFVCELELFCSIAKTVDKYGEKGCPEKTLLCSVFNETFEKKKITGLQEILFQEIISSVEKKGIIKSKIDEEGKKKYFIDNPERRSLYNLFNYYLNGYRDKEISEKFNMTVAGIGSMKRSLRKEINKLETFK